MRRIGAWSCSVVGSLGVLLGWLLWKMAKAIEGTEI